TLALNASATSRAVNSPAATPSRIALTPSSAISLIRKPRSRTPVLRRTQHERVWLRPSPQTPFALSLSKGIPAPSLDHLRNAEEPVLGHRGVGEYLVAYAAAGERIGVDHVLAQPQLLRD